MQSFYFNGEELLPQLVWDESKGLNFVDMDLSGKLCERKELLDVKNRKYR